MTPGTKDQGEVDYQEFLLSYLSVAPAQQLFDFECKWRTKDPLSYYDSAILHFSFLNANRKWRFHLYSISML